MTTNLSTSKQFLYLVQSAGKLPPSYDDLQSENSDLILLTWKEPIEGAIHFPKSSWTQGRNRLAEEALKNTSYLYYIFLDDDVAFSNGGWREFEVALLKYQPAIAVPYFGEYLSGTPFNNLKLEVQTCYAFDAIYNAFHRDVLLDGVILPYCASFDPECWFYSQWFIIHLARMFFPRHTLQINTVSIKNGKHEPYPRNYNPKRIRKWFQEEVLRSPGLLPLTLRERIAPRISSSTLRRLIWKPCLPSPPLSSYRTSAQQKQRIQLNYREKQPELVIEPSVAQPAGGD